MAGYFAGYLADHDHDIFIQTKVAPGQTWPEVVGFKLKEAELFDALLSDNSVRSKCSSRRFAAAFVREANGHPRLLLARLEAKVDLPYDVGARVNRAQAFE